MHDDHTHKDIRTLAPTLYGLQGKTSFRVPEGYFDVLPLAIEAHIEPTPETPDVPDHFFEGLKADILAQTVEREAPAGRTIPFKKWGAVTASIAAALVLVFTLLPEGKAECQSFACLFEQATEQDLLNVMDEGDLIDLLDPSEGADMGDSGVTEYLLLEEVSLDALIEEWDVEDLPETW